MNISPISDAVFRAGKVNINIPNVDSKNLYNYEEYQVLASLEDADINIKEKEKLESFYLKNYKHYSIGASKVYDGKVFESKTTVSLPKNTSISITEAEIRKAVYNTLSFLKEKIVSSIINKQK